MINYILYFFCIFIFILSYKYKYRDKRIYNNLKDLNSKIQEEKIETIVEYGLHQFVTQFIRKISSVDNEIHKEFFN